MANDKHRDAARSVLERIKGANAMILSPLAVDAVSGLLALTEHNAREEAVAPFVALMLWERDNYRSVVVERTDPDEVWLSCLDENDKGLSASGKTATEAARDLCAKLNLKAGPE
ncbi:MAG TPA: hypothetical protein VJN18_35625 [Polyangiaceae bacterium]|nr:hypothetical protein [Polyangiaceae bacterium]